MLLFFYNGNFNWVMKPKADNSFQNAFRCGLSRPKDIKLSLLESRIKKFGKSIHPLYIYQIEL